MFNETTLHFPTDLPLAVLEPAKETPKQPGLFLSIFIRITKKAIVQ